jgi:hypothetical protein
LPRLDDIMIQRSRRFLFAGLSLVALGASPALAQEGDVRSESEGEPAPAEGNGQKREEPRVDDGDETFGGGAAAAPGTYTLRTLIQTRYQQTSTSIEPGLRARVEQESFDARAATENLRLIDRLARDTDGFQLNRVFLRATAQPTSSLGVKMLVDFAELVHKNQKKALKLAYGEFTPWERLTITVGLFKIPFSLTELLPIADFELADVGPTDTLLKDLGVGGRDIGVMVDLAPLPKKKWLHLFAGAFQGDNVGAQDYRGPGILAARATSRPWKHLRLGADFAWRPREVNDWDKELPFLKYHSGVATSADVAFTMKKFELRAEWVTGDRTDATVTAPVVIYGRADARRFMGVWAIAAYRFPLGAYTLMPALRAEWLDADREHPTGGLVYLTAGLNLEFSPQVRLLLDVSHQNTQVGTIDRGVDTGRYQPDATRVVLQLQLKL